MYEIEIKSLLGSQERSDILRKKLTGKNARALGKHSQLNHYFVVPSDPFGLERAIGPLVDEENSRLLHKILSSGTKISLRTRQADNKVLLVAKASVGDDTSANGVSRIELESSVDKTLDELDKLLLSAGASYEAKWSREREEYELGNLLISIDKNAGYGYLAEFEKQVERESDIAKAKKEVLSFMAEVGAEELSQGRLERMFKYYNEHWQEYYGTDKTFTIE
jgi:predicted adenylyl cyclase CyaB